MGLSSQSRASSRSRVEVGEWRALEPGIDVSKVAKHFKGGGHAAAAEEGRLGPAPEVPHGVLAFLPGRRVVAKEGLAGQLLEALDWMVAQNESAESPYANKIATSLVAAMGMSCGGIHALQIATTDPRVDTTVLARDGQAVPTARLPACATS